MYYLRKRRDLRKDGKASVIYFLFGLVMHKPLQSFLLIFIQAGFYHITDRVKDFFGDFYILNCISHTTTSIIICLSHLNNICVLIKRFFPPFSFFQFLLRERWFAKELREINSLELSYYCKKRLE